MSLLSILHVRSFENVIQLTRCCAFSSLDEQKTGEYPNKILLHVKNVNSVPYITSENLFKAKIMMKIGSVIFALILNIRQPDIQINIADFLRKSNCSFIQQFRNISLKSLQQFNRYSRPKYKSKKQQHFLHKPV